MEDDRERGTGNVQRGRGRREERRKRGRWIRRRWGREGEIERALGDSVEDVFSRRCQTVMI